MNIEGGGHGMQSSGVWALQPLADISEDEFRDWQLLLEERTGLVISSQRKAHLQASLSARMREVGAMDYASYYRKVTDGPRGSLEWMALLDWLTVKETSFFRHPPSFDVLTKHLRKRLQSSESSSCSLWSVGCASGEEACSLAIAAAEVLRETGRSYDFGVTGSDISLKALQVAREGEYATRKLERLDPTIRQRYFHCSGEGRYKVMSDLAVHLCYARLNVLDLANAPFSGMDVIFCQNLLIYFRRWRRRDILNRLAERLAPGGLLMLGVGEVSGWQHPDLIPVADQRVLAFTRMG
jgi:type IV pilus assembly protein PilK